MGPGPLGNWTSLHRETRGLAGWSPELQEPESGPKAPSDKEHTAELGQPREHVPPPPCDRTSG